MQYTFPVPADEKDLRPAFNVEKKTYSNPDTISAEVERYLNNYSPKTVKAYRSDLFDFHNFVKMPLQNTREDHILKYIEHLENEKLSNSTINRRIASLSKLSAIYVAMGLMKYNPVQNLGALGKLYKPVSVGTSFKTVTKMDVEAVIANSRKKTSAIVKFLANTGLRVSEMIGIKKEDLEPYNTDFMRIKVLGKGRKIRFIYISYELYQNVKDAFDSDSIYLFTSTSGNQLSRVNLYRQINRSFLKHAHKKDVGPHTLRHFFATQKIVEEKKDYKAVSTYLGHANPSLTMSYYVSSVMQPEDTVII
ncbi:MAG: tyrosine-type recombinase/integrase [Sphaerochaetaceae bacterium]|nr:tyrosine-type recombinase/integrase [Sphaerochaetaceae bacterium]